MLRSALVLLFVTVSSAICEAQSMAPGVAARPRPVAKPLVAPVIGLVPPPPPPPAPVLPVAPAAAAVNPNTDCVGGGYTSKNGVKPWFLPLNRNGSDEDDVTCFFAAGGVVAPLTQVNFLYGFGSSSSTISVDLIAAQTPLGFQVSLGSSLSGSQSGSSSSSTSSTVSGQATPAQAVQQLENGGDFYVRGIWPLLYGSKPTKLASGFVAFVPRLGINVPGMSAQTTVTTDPEYNWNIAPEAYGQLAFYKNKGFLYGDVRSGYQYVQPTFAQTVGLGTKNNFLSSQFAGGVQFTGIMRIGFEKYQGPAQTLISGQNTFNKWHLVIQLSPSNLISSLKGS
jgi:hypothetical protein